jgi:hypothetical protein
MTYNEILTEVQNEFSGIPRPKMFIRGTCLCTECLEHEEDMQKFWPDNLPLHKLDNPGWDPICFASDDAFAYMVPGLIKLVLDYTDDYIQQFLFHIGQEDRIAILSKGQRCALIHVLDFLKVNSTYAIENNVADRDMKQTRKKLCKSLS